MQRPPHIEQQIERFVDRFFEGLVAQAENKDEASAYKRMSGSAKVRREYSEAFGFIIDAAAEKHGRWPNPYGILASSEAFPGDIGQRVFYERPKHGVDGRALREWQEYARARQLNPIPKKAPLAPRSSQPYPSVTQSHDGRMSMQGRMLAETEHTRLRAAHEKVRSLKERASQTILGRMEQLVKHHGGEYVLYLEGNEPLFFDDPWVAANQAVALYGSDAPYVIHLVEWPITVHSFFHGD